MFAVTFKTVRPNTSIPWFARTPDVVSAVSDCKSEGKLLSEEWSVSENGLIGIYKAVWASKEDKSAFDNSPIMAAFIEERKSYLTEHGMKMFLIEALEF